MTTILDGPAYDPASNYPAEMHDELLATGSLARCSAKPGPIFSVRHVEVTGRYADCTMFLCPVCGSREHDTRPRGGGNPNARQGYTVVRPPQITDDGIIIY